MGIHNEGNLEHFLYKVLFSVMKAGIVKNLIDTYKKLNICMWMVSSKTDDCNSYKNDNFLLITLYINDIGKARKCSSKAN